MIEKIRVKAPATSANVGPGFDVFAFALNMYNEAIFERIETGIEILGCPPDFANEDNLAYKAYKSVFDEAGVRMGGVRFTEYNTIPFCRGLGSSAAMIAEGAVAANEMIGRPFEKHELLELCLKIEPHPDNLAACIYGGFTSAIKLDDRHIIRKTNVNKELNFYAIITSQQVETEASRQVLPKTVSLNDAIFNISRASMIPAAFEAGDKELLKVLLDDRLHQPFRKKLIDDYEEVRSLTLESGAYAFYISGSGSTCIAMSDEPFFKETCMESLKKLGIERKIIELKVDNDGAMRI